MILLVVFIVLGITSCGDDDTEVNTPPQQNDVDTNYQEDTTPQEEIVEDVVEDEGETTNPIVASGIRPEIKNALDSYEIFFDEYVTFMNTYANSDNPLLLMQEYADFMTRYSEVMQKMSEIENSDLNDEEMLYFLQVQSRISAKLLQVQ